MSNGGIPDTGGTVGGWEPPTRSERISGLIAECMVLLALGAGLLIGFFLGRA